MPPWQRPPPPGADWDETPAAERAAILERAADAWKCRGRADFAPRARSRQVPARRAPAKCGKRPTFCAITRRRRARSSPRRCSCRGRRANRTGSSWPAAASSRVSAPGIFRSRYSRARSSAALAAGNAVVAKPAEQTPLVAARAVALMHEAGVPRDVLRRRRGDRGHRGRRARAPSRSLRASPLPARSRPRSPSTARSLRGTAPSFRSSRRRGA